MRACFSFFRIRFLAGLQYRSAAWAGIATQFVWGGMTLLLYAAFYKTGADAFPMTFPALASYIWLQQAFLAFFAMWYFEPELVDACIFELNALQSRYNYLLRLVKESGGIAASRIYSEGAVTWV